MKQFDEQLRKRVQQEHWQASKEARMHLLIALEKAERKTAPAPSARRWRAALAVGLVGTAVLLMTLSDPRKDILNESGMLPAHQETIVQTQGKTDPVRPNADLNVKISQEALQAEAVFSNQTEDIWLLQWSARPLSEAEYQTGPLVWLEPGVQFTDSLKWPLPQSRAEEQPVIEWKYTAYRVTAKIIQWLDEEWLKKGQEGYERQQDLLEAAWEAQALILFAGEWPGGQAGEVRLVLPDTHMQEDLLAYYASIEALEKGAEEHEVVAGSAQPAE